MNGLKVAVCVCTYRRAAQLDQLLKALAELRWAQLPVPAVTVVVVENELDGPGKEVCDKHRAQGKLDIRYAAEPLAGVPVARNRCLDLTADWSDFIAFIDDDELPEADWLEQLLLQQAAARADVVAGPVLASYVVPPPDWLVRGGFHDLSPPIVPRGTFLQKLSSALIPRITDPDRRASGSPVQWFNTGNVLLRSDVVRRMGLRFDESLRQIGYGEDTLFSKRIAKAGYRMVWSNEAVTHHMIPSSRMTAGWLIRRAVQQGYCTAILDQKLGGDSASRAPIALFRLIRALFSILVLPAALFAGRHYVVWHLLRVALYAGRCANSLGLKLQYNRRAPTHAAAIPAKGN